MESLFNCRTIIKFNKKEQQKTLPRHGLCNDKEPGLMYDQAVYTWQHSFKLFRTKQAPGVRTCLYIESYVHSSPISTNLYLLCKVTKPCKSTCYCQIRVLVILVVKYLLVLLEIHLLQSAENVRMNIKDDPYYKNLYKFSLLS